MRNGLNEPRDDFIGTRVALGRLVHGRAPPATAAPRNAREFSKSYIVPRTSYMDRLRIPAASLRILSKSYLVNRKS